MAERRLGGSARGAIGLAAALVLVGVMVGSSTLGLLLTPLVLLLLIYAMTQAPLRYSLMGLMFLAFTLENPAEQPADGRWKSPFYNVGGIMLNHMNTVDRSIGATSWIFFSGMDICLLALFLIAVVRNGRSKLDRDGHLATPRPLVRLAHVSVVGMLWIWLTGLVSGGDYGMSLWQLDRVMYLPIVFLLFHRGLRGPKDLGDLARVVLAAAVFRALLAIYVVNVAELPPDVSLTYATSHHDSMLFAIAIVILVVMVVQRVDGSGKTAIFLLPLVAAGIVANNRRMAWVLVGAVLFAGYLVSPDNPLKKRLRRVVFLSTPLFAIYVLAGWNSAGRFFKPARIIRSVVDAESDASSLWREMENYDIVATLRMNPILGTGYGHGYVEFVPLPEVSYPLERFIPHNSLLGLWCYGGYIGYTALTLLWVGGVYFALRAYYAAKDRTHRVAAIVSFGTVVIYLLQGWGDIGIGAWTGVFLMAPALAIAGKLAVANGQWGKKTRSAEPPPRSPGSWDAKQAA